MVKNTQLAKAKARSLTKPSTAGLAPNSQLASDRAILCEQMMFKMRMLTNQPMLDDPQLQVAGALWAEELIKAGIPPSKWYEMFSLAREARPASSKAFMITVDQVIATWEHYLRGHVWIFEDQAWDPRRKRISYCNKCRKDDPRDPAHVYYGYVWEKRIVMRHGQECTREGWWECQCQIAQKARDSYHFRYFSAKYEIKCGVSYEPSDADLRALYRAIDRYDALDWSNAVVEYFGQAENPTLQEMCGRRS